MISLSIKFDSDTLKNLRCSEFCAFYKCKVLQECNAFPLLKNKNQDIYGLINGLKLLTDFLNSQKYENR